MYVQVEALRGREDGHDVVEGRDRAGGGGGEAGLGAGGAGRHAAANTAAPLPLLPLLLVVVLHAVAHVVHQLGLAPEPLLALGAPVPAAPS